MAAKKSTDVIIAGKSYTLSGYEEEGYLQRIADYINQKIAELDESGVKRRISNDTRAILIGLNMANDYYKIRDQFDEMDDNYKKTEKELFNLKHELVETQMRVDELLADLEKEKKKARSKPAADKEMVARCQKLEEENKTLSEDLATQVENQKKLESKYQALSEHSKQLEEANSKLNAANEELKGNNAKLEEQCQSLSKLPVKNGEEYKRLETEKKALETEVQELRLNKKRLEKTLEDALLGALQNNPDDSGKNDSNQEVAEHVLTEEEELEELARQIEELERQERESGKKE